MTDKNLEIFKMLTRLLEINNEARDLLYSIKEDKETKFLQNFTKAERSRSLMLIQEIIDYGKGKGYDVKPIEDLLSEQRKNDMKQEKIDRIINALKNGLAIYEKKDGTIIIPVIDQRTHAYKGLVMDYITEKNDVPPYVMTLNSLVSYVLNNMAKSDMAKYINFEDNGLTADDIDDFVRKAIVKHGHVDNIVIEYNDSLSDCTWIKAA